MTIKIEDTINDIDARLKVLVVKLYGKTLANGFMTMSEIFNHAKDTLKNELLKEMPKSILESVKLETIMERVEICIINQQSGVGDGEA
jgi:hypothetical protein